MFHGTAQDGELFYQESKWREKADEEGLLSVFPTALVYCYHTDPDGDGIFNITEVKEKWANGALGDPEQMPLCTGEEIDDVGAQGFIRFHYDESQIGASNTYSFMMLGGMGHQYGNGEDYPIVLADEVWNFFQDESLP